MKRTDAGVIQRAGSCDHPIPPQFPDGGGAPASQLLGAGVSWWQPTLLSRVLARWLELTNDALQYLSGTQESYILATPTGATPSAVPSLCPDISLQLLFLCSNR